MLLRSIIVSAGTSPSCELERLVSTLRSMLRGDDTSMYVSVSGALGKIERLGLSGCWPTARRIYQVEHLC